MDEASQLIEALKSEPKTNHTEGYLKKNLWIDIESDARDGFHMKIPIKMVKQCLSLEVT